MYTQSWRVLSKCGLILGRFYTQHETVLQQQSDRNSDQSLTRYKSIVNATRRSKETVKEYCFRMSTGIQHRELQNNIAAINFSSMKEFCDATESYFINRGRHNTNKEFLPKLNTFEVRLKNYMNQSKPREARFLATDEICQAAQVMRLGTSN